MTDGWLQRATERTVLVRAMLTCAVVGVVLTAINHGDAIVSGDMDQDRTLRIALTFVVPFVVLVTSSVAAIGRERRDRLPSVVTSPDTTR